MSNEKAFETSPVQRKAARFMPIKQRSEKSDSVDAPNRNCFFRVNPVIHQACSFPFHRCRLKGDSDSNDVAVTLRGPAS